MCLKTRDPNKRCGCPFGFVFAASQKRVQPQQTDGSFRQDLDFQELGGQIAWAEPGLPQRVTGPVFASIGLALGVVFGGPLMLVGFSSKPSEKPQFWGLPYSETTPSGENRLFQETPGTTGMWVVSGCWGDRRSDPFKGY